MVSGKKEKINPLKITEINITLCNEKHIMAYADISFNDAFAIHGFKVMKGRSGYYVAMPSRRVPDGSFQDIVYPKQRFFNTILQREIIYAYKQKLEEKKQNPDDFD